MFPKNPYCFPIPEMGYLRRELPALPKANPVYWIGSSKKDLREMPQAVKQHVGAAIAVAQRGSKHPSAKPWKGAGSGVFEIVSHDNGNTFRVVYTVRFSGAVYILHCFNKKSPNGVKTARTDINLISKRLKVARQDYEVRNGEAENGSS